MNKSDLVLKIASKLGKTQKEANVMLDAVLDTITESLASGEKVSIVGFGSFTVKTRQGRSVPDPVIPSKKIAVPPQNVTCFKPSKSLKEAVKCTSTNE